MKRKSFTQKTMLIGLTMLLMMTGCQNNQPCPENNTPMKEQMRDYLESRGTAEAQHRFAPGYSAYFDFSDGMEYAYKGDNKTNLESVSKLITGFRNDWDVYSLAYDQVKHEDMSQTELWQTIINTKYTAVKAPINGALGKIVADNKLALLVTDFEEYEKSDQMGKDVIEETAYATDEFEQWLLKGGVIKFYIMDFVETNDRVQLQKKLFFVVFDNKEMELSTKIDNALVGGPKNYQEYVLKRDAYEVFTDYKPGKGGNYEDVVDPMILAGFEKYRGQNVEFYDMTNPWSVVVAQHYQAKQMDSKCLGLLSKLYVNLSDEESVQIQQLKLRVTDITDDFYAYSNNKFALSFKPVPDPATGEIVIDPKSPTACFYDPDGTLLPEYEYAPLSTPDVYDELLVINQKAFDESRAADPSKTQIVIDFDKIYTEAEYVDDGVGGYAIADQDLLSQLSKFDGRILKVEVCVASTGYNGQLDKLSKLFDFKSNIWKRDGQRMVRLKDVPNDCISVSIRNVLKQSGKLDYSDKVIYTYIIKG